MSRCSDMMLKVKMCSHPLQKRRAKWVYDKSLRFASSADLFLTHSYHRIHMHDRDKYKWIGVIVWTNRREVTEFMRQAALFLFPPLKHQNCLKGLLRHDTSLRSLTQCRITICFVFTFSIRNVFTVLSNALKSEVSADITSQLYYLTKANEMYNLLRRWLWTQG